MTKLDSGQILGVAIHGGAPPRWPKQCLPVVSMSEAVGVPGTTGVSTLQVSRTVLCATLEENVVSRRLGNCAVK
jgi:hypothetical protein